MGEAKRRKDSVNQCIYCGATGTLTREHVIPFGLGGDLVLDDASCEVCAKETCKLEGRLLRGHWWPYRLHLGIKSRTKGDPIPDLPIFVIDQDGKKQPASLPMSLQSVALVFELDPPAILLGQERTDEPNAPRVYMKYFAPPPSVVTLGGKEHHLSSTEKIEIPVNFDVADLCRFLAKIAHGFAISRRGKNACRKFYLPEIILGKTIGAQTYIGGCSSPFIDKTLPGNGLHAMLDRINGNYLTVYIQLFRQQDDPPPIYEIVVGEV